MCGDYFNLNARRGEPLQPPVTGYHIHIYFEAGGESEKSALEVARRIDALFPGAADDFHRVGKVGPHTAPNIGLSLAPESFGEVVGWLQRNSQGLSILVHPRTGDEVADHEAALWLGKPVPLNMAFFESLKPVPPKGPSRG